MYTALMMRPEDNVAMVLQPTPAESSVKIVNQATLLSSLLTATINFL